jgi:hypothetical protein
MKQSFTFDVPTLADVVNVIICYLVFRNDLSCLLQKSVLISLDKPHDDAEKDE